MAFHLVTPGIAAQKAGACQLAIVHVSREFSSKEKEITTEAGRAFKGKVYVPRPGAIIKL